MPDNTWYRSGTVQVTNGSTSVVANDSPAWADVATIRPGDLFTVDHDSFYEITAATNTTLTLGRAYTGATDTAATYAIIRLNFITLSNPDLATRLSNTLYKWQQREDEIAAWQAGTPSGGPLGNRKYPLTDPSGTTVMVYCPQKLAELAGVIQGLPPGGTAGQVPVKRTSTDYDVEWRTPEAGGSSSNATISTLNPFGGMEGDVWYKVSS
jgi:hypothetical protein